jgi:hypothetical protein
VLACLALVGAIACHDSSTNPGTADISGTYTLQSIGGVPMPFTAHPDANTAITFSSDVLTVGTDGTWSETQTIQAVANGQTTSDTSTGGGTWTRAGTTVNFSSEIDGSLVYVGRYGDNTLTLDAGDGLALVFRR